MHGYDEDKAKVIARLRRIEGQVRAITQMVEDDKYCIDILTQISASNSALKSVAQLLGWIVILVTADDLRTADTRHRFIEMAHVVVSRQRNLADWNRSWAITS